MKKLSLMMVMAILFAANVMAQTTKGTWYVGGGLGFSSSNEKTKSGSISADGDKTSSFNIKPGVGFFISDKISLGIDVGFTTSTLKSPNNDKSKSSIFSINPYARYYMMLNDNFGFTGTLGIGYASGTSKIEGGGISVDGPKSTQFSFGVTPGLVYFPTNKIGLEANFGFVGYTSDKFTSTSNTGVKTEQTTNQFALGANSINPQFSLGFRYYFTK
jgi:outer membrane protein